MSADTALLVRRVDENTSDYVTVDTGSADNFSPSKPTETLCVVSTAVENLQGVRNMSGRQPSQSPRNYRLTFHFCYATVIKAVDARYDIRGYMLAELVKLCLKNRARIRGD